MAMLVRFWVNHHLLDVLQRPIWRVVAGRSRTYVDAILAGLLPCGLDTALNLGSTGR